MAINTTQPRQVFNKSIPSPPPATQSSSCCWSTHGGRAGNPAPRQTLHLASDSVLASWPQLLPLPCFEVPIIDPLASESQKPQGKKKKQSSPGWLHYHGLTVLFVRPEALKRGLSCFQPGTPYGRSLVEASPSSQEQGDL